MKDELFPKRVLIKLLIPLFIEQILAVTIGMADTMMVSSVGEAAVSSVSLVDNINILLIQIFSSLAAGGAVIVAQYVGRGDYKNANSAAKQLMYSILILTMFITVFSLVFNKQILRLIFGNIEEDVMRNAVTYYYVTVASYPFLAIYNSCAGLFRAMGNSKISMYISIAMNLINITGNAIFIFGFDMGVFGAALATLISRIIGSIFILILICNQNNIVYVEKLFKPELNLNMIKNILKIGIPNGLENGMFQIGKLLVAGLITTFGTTAIAANAVSGSITGIAMIPGGAIGLGMITIVGQCVGAGEYGQAEYYTKKLMIMMLISMGVLNLLLFIFCPQFVSLYKLSPDSSKTAIEILKIYAVMTATVWPFSFGLPNSLRAAGDAKFTMLTSITSMWLFRIGFSYILAQFFNLGLHGVWIAMYIDWVFRSILFITRFLKGKWKKIKVI